MSDSTESTAEAGEQVEQTPGEEQGFKAPSSQEELDRIIQNRVARVESKYSDYDDLRAKAEKADEFEATNADLKKRVESFEAAEARNSIVRSVAEAHQVDASLLAEMRGDTEDELTAQAKRLADRTTTTAPVIPGQAKSPENPPRDERRNTVKQLFG